MAELIPHKPFKDDSHASERELPAGQAVEAGAIMREAVSARTDAGSESAHDSPSRWLTCIGGGTHVVRCGSAPFPCCREGRRTTLDTPFLPLLPAWLPSAVQVFPGCAPSSSETLLVCSFVSRTPRSI